MRSALQPTGAALRYGRAAAWFAACILAADALKRRSHGLSNALVRKLEAAMEAAGGSGRHERDQAPSGCDDDTASVEVLAPLEEGATQNHGATNNDVSLAAPLLLLPERSPTLTLIS